TVRWMPVPSTRTYGPAGSTRWIGGTVSSGAPRIWPAVTVRPEAGATRPRSNAVVNSPRWVTVRLPAPVELSVIFNRGPSRLAVICAPEVFVAAAASLIRRTTSSKVAAPPRLTGNETPSRRVIWNCGSLVWSATNPGTLPAKATSEVTSALMTRNWTWLPANSATTDESRPAVASAAFRSRMRSAREVLSAWAVAERWTGLATPSSTRTKFSGMTWEFASTDRPVAGAWLPAVSVRD